MAGKLQAQGWWVPTYNIKILHLNTSIEFFHVSAARTPADTVFLDEADKDDNKDTVKGDKANNDNSEMEDEDDQMGVSIKCPK